MTAIGLTSDLTVSKPGWRDFKRRLRALFVLWRRRRRVIRAYLELSALDERLLYDMGIEPLDLRAALRNQPNQSPLRKLVRRHLDPS